MTTEEKYIQHVEECFAKADRNESKLIQEVHDIQGMTGTKTRHLYNNLLNMEDARYLEIGSWAGSSSCSAMYGNKAKCAFIENFAGFGGPKQECLSNIEKFKGENEVEFYEEDCFQFDVSKFKQKFNIYVPDGDHSESSHFQYISRFYEAMDDIFILVVDDANWFDVVNGTNMGILATDLKILWQKNILLTADGTYTKDQQVAKDTWWNGLICFVLKK